jgi:putative transposase
VNLTYRYRLLPSKRQHRALVGLLAAQRALYNAALEERIDCYRKTGKGARHG